MGNIRKTALQMSSIEIKLFALDFKSKSHVLITTVGKSKTKEILKFYSLLDKEQRHEEGYYLKCKSAPF